MPGNAVCLDQRDEVVLGVSAERRMAEPRIVGQKIRRGRMQIGEIASPSAGDADFFAGMPRLLKQQHGPSALGGDTGAHQSRRARAEDDDVMAIRCAGYAHSTSRTSTATPSFCLRDPTITPSTGETSEKSRPTASTMWSFSTRTSLVDSKPTQPISSP